MSFLKKIFGTKDTPTHTYEDFWNWFQENEKSFFKVIKTRGNIEKDFFDKLSPKLNELREGLFYLTGMVNENTAELILTVEGALKNIVFVEELINAAPKIDGWLFTALKPPLDIKGVTINMGPYQFNCENISFYQSEDKGFPDEINVTIVYHDFNSNDKDSIINGVYIFLDNFLGELNFATSIDNLAVIGKKDATRELVPIEKLKDFLIWREKEFIEKYHGTWLHTDTDSHTLFEAKIKSGNPLLATINMDLLNWDSKASHPWILNIEVNFAADQNGMPNVPTYELLTALEEDILADLKDIDGYLYIGRQTAEGAREIYFACKDFRKPSKIMDKIHQKYDDKFNIGYEIYKDKYWQSFNRFLVN